MTVDSPHLILDTPLFRGIEHEGPNQGARTLFIASSQVTMRNIKGHLPTVDHVYFGAGRLSPIAYELCHAVLEYRPCKKLTLEVSCLPAQEKLSLLQLHTAAAQAASADRILFVLTARMQLPSGKEFASWPDAVATFTDLEQQGVNVALKIDNGKYVRVLHKDKLYVNPLDVSYAADLRLPLL
jgi:hypothetical protein